MKIRIIDIIGVSVAISDKQANQVKEKINYEDVVILDFAGITDVTTAFLNIIMDGFFGRVETASEILSKLSFENYNESVKFAFGDAYELFKERIKK